MSTRLNIFLAYITQNKKHLIAIILVFFITLAIRMLSINEVFVDGNVIYYDYDSYYHMRRVVYTVLHFPNTLWYDSYVAYPSGFEITWPPLYDFTIAFISILASFGSPDIYSVEKIGAIFPAVLGALTAVLVYILATKIFDSRVGLLSAFLLAISTAHIRVSILGNPDHHVAEVFLFAAVILVFTIIVDKVTIIKKTINCNDSAKHTNKQQAKNKKNFQNIQSKGSTDYTFSSIHPTNYINKKTILGSITLGILFTAIVLTWMGAPIYLAIFILYIFLQYCFHVYYMRISLDIMFITGTAFLTSLIILMPFYLFTDWMPLYQIITIAIFLAISIIFGIIANINIRKEWHWYIYPLFTITLTTIIFISVKQLLPQYYHTILNGFSYLAGEGFLRTVTEAMPLFDSVGGFMLEMFFSDKFGLNLFFATFGIVIYLINGIMNLSTKKEIKQSHVLLLVVTISTFILTIYQKRFAYLFSVFAAIFASYLFYKLSDLALETYITKSREYKSLKKSTKKRRATNNQELKQLARSEIPPVIFILLLLIAPSAYYSYLLITTPPAISNDWYDAARWLKTNTPATSYYNDPVSLPEYSIMSWWDYGNWIQYVGNRPVVANNFQTGVDAAAKYFTITNESAANTILDKHATKYVVVNTEMGYGYKNTVYGKYSSVLNIAGKNKSDYLYSFEYPTPFYTTNQLLLNDMYYDTVFARLLLLDGSSIVNPNNDRADALSHYRLVYESDETGITHDVNISKIKIFEYVQGAVIQGTTLPNSEVEISIPVTTNRNRTFSYVNHIISDQTGSFEFIVPYSTYDVSTNTELKKAKYDITVNGVFVDSISVDEEQVLNHEIIYFDVVGTDIPENHTDERKTNPIVMNISWSYDMNGNIKYAPDVIDDVIYVTSGNDISGINIKEKTLSFKQDMGGSILTPYSKKGTDLYFVSIDNYNVAKIYTIDDSGIMEKFTLPQTHTIKTLSPLQVDDDKLYIGVDNGLYAINTISGRVEWKFDAPDHIIAKPTSVGDTVYLTSYNGTAIALDASSGSVKWTSHLENKSWTPLVYADSVLVTGTRDNFINGLDARSGEIIWKYKTGYFVDSTPLFLDGVVYVASYDGKIYALDSQNGDLIWKSDQFAPIFAKPVIFNDTLFVGTWDGKFYKIDISNGETKAFSDLDGPIISSALIMDDMAYVATLNGMVYAIRI